MATPLAAMLGRGTSSSTHMGELSRAALRRSMRAYRVRWPERLLRRVGGVGVSGLASGGRSSMSKPLPVATKSRLPNRSTVPAGSGRGSSAIQETRENEDKMSRSAAPTWRANCRCPDPAVRHQLVKCCVIPHPGWLMQEITQERTGLSWFRPWGRTSSKGVCESTVLSCTGGACSRGYKRGERGREAHRSLLDN